MMKNSTISNWPALLCLLLFSTLFVFFPIISHANISEYQLFEIRSSIQSLQVPFVVNKGQIDDRVAFAARTLDGTMFVTTTGELVYSLGAKDQDPADQELTIISEQLIDANVERITGFHPASTRVNYFPGKDSEKWIRDVKTYMAVSFGEVYKGIELQLKAYGDNVEKLFYVAPGALPEQIRLKIFGADSLQISDQGQLVLHTRFGSIAFTRPVAWQEIDGNRIPVNIDYKLCTDAGHPGEYSFAVGFYDPSSPLVIDPLLASTFIGGSGEDTGHSIALDSQGNVYVTGETSSPAFPADIYDTSYNGGDRDVFVSKLSPDLTTLLASTFIGGANNDIAYSLAIDASDNIYITGATASPDYPVTACDTTFNNNTNNDFTDIFISKFSSDLSTLIASTFIGGVNSEEGKSLGILSGNIYVTGSSSSPDFPTTDGAYATTLHGTSASNDIFVVKMPSDLSTLTAATFIGGGIDDSGRALAFDSENNIFITGSTSSADFPSTTAYDFEVGGGKQVFIVKLSSDLATLAASSVIGGGGTTSIGYGIQVDSSDNIFITGETDSSTFPTTDDACDRSNPSSYDAFVTRLDNDLTTIMASTFLGTGSWDKGYSIVLDESDNVYVAGYTNSGDFPTTPLAYDRVHGAGDDAFITKFSPALTTVLSSTLLGTDGTIWGRSLVRDTMGNIYITGNATVFSSSHPFPTTIGAYDESWNSGKDVFVSRFDSELSGSSLQFSSANYDVSESSTETTVTVTRVGSSSGGVSVDYTTGDGTATEGSDYNTSTGTLFWADGDTVDKTFSVTILPDDDVEGRETVILSLGNPTGIPLGPPQTAVLNIIDDETPGIVQFSAATFDVDENDVAGTATITVTRTSGSSGIVTVDYASSDGTATSGIDYTATSGTLTWGDGDTTEKTILVDIADNGDLDGDKTLILSLNTPTGLATLGSQNTATLTIRDDEVAGSLQFSMESYPVMEDSGQAVITVTRLGGTDGEVSVEYFTLDDTAVEDSDYTAQTGTLTWADGDSSDKTFSVPIIDDSIIEGEEKVTLTLHNQTGSATLGLYNVANINISDDDDPASQDTLQFSMSDYTISEDGAEAVITVTRTDSNGQAVSVHYATGDDTAVSGEDYTATSGVLNWAAYDSSSRTFSIAITDDIDDEDNETVALTLSNPTGGAVTGTVNPALLTILDNDVPAAQPGSIEFDVPVYSAWEDDGSFDVTVFRVGGIDGEVSVNFATSDSTAVAGSDYDEISGTLTWQDGDGDYKIFTVQINDDIEYEGDESVNLTLDSPTGGAVLGTRPAAVLKIMDNDPSTGPGTLQFSSPTYSVGETGSQVTITVTRSGGSSGYVSVDYATGDITAVVGGDYDEMSGSLDWSDGDMSSRTFEVTILDDFEVEGNETLRLTLSNPVRATLGSFQNAVVTIIDNEIEPEDEPTQVNILPILNLLLNSTDDPLIAR